MAEALKVLGQEDSNGSNQTLYTVPASTQTSVATFIACNRTAGTVTFRVAIVPSGDTLSDKHWLVYDDDISANSPYLLHGFSLNDGDSIIVNAAASSVSFSAFGVEVS